jgi:poly(3-hydroxybutyrate) depolymerase
MYREVLCFLLAVAVSASAAEAAAAPATGAFEIQRTLAEALGEESAAGLTAIVPPDRPVSWEVYVPEGYDPADPPGLLVYISPIQSGRIPDNWERVLESRNLIWVSANKSGNQVHVQRRALYAVIAPTLIGADYQIDRSRIYLTGMSGGGKMASMVAVDHAHLFKGAVYNCGVEFWDKKPQRIEQVKANRYVFVTGEYDQALRPTRRVHGRYRKAGVENVKLMVIDGMGHENPPWREMDEALAFLDGEPSDG